MKLPRRALVVLVAVCALPARGSGGDAALPPEILHLLTPIDCTPTSQELTARLGPQPGEALGRLRGFALDATVDFGMRLRAVRAIPLFCRSHPIECHTALFDVFQDIDQSADSPGKKILRYRAAIEAIGAAEARSPADVQKLIGFVAHPSRDLRVSAVRALRDLCAKDAIPALEDRLENSDVEKREKVPQVQIAITGALQILRNCSTP